MFNKLRKTVLFLIALIGIFVVLQQKEVFADTTEEAPIVVNEVNLVPDMELAKQLNSWGRVTTKNWPSYPEITQEKFDLMNQYEGDHTFVLSLAESTKSIQGLEYLQPKVEVRIAISGDTIDDLTPLAQIGNLVHLDLAVQHLSQDELTAISQLKDLKILTFVTDTTIDLNIVASMKNLNYLAIQGANQRIAILPPTTSFNLSKLETFYLFYTGLTGVDFIVTHMSNVSQLLIISTPISQIDSFEQLPNLEGVFLFDTFVGKIPPKVTPLLESDPSGINSENNWYQGTNVVQNQLGTISNQEMVTQDTLQINVPLTIADSSVFISVMEMQNMELLTSSDLFQAEITSSNPAVVSVDQTSNVQQISLSSHKRGTAVITYKLPSNTAISFEVTVHGNGIAPIVQGNNVVYENGLTKTEADYIQDAGIITDTEAMITTNFEQVVKLDQAGEYTVTVYATDEDGIQSQSIQLTVTVEAKKNTPPNVTPAQPGIVLPNQDEEKPNEVTKQQRNEKETLPKTASQDTQSLFFLGSFLLLAGIIFIGKKHFSLK